MQPRGTTYGIGVWSPDSRFVMAGSRPHLAFYKKLVIVDTVTDQLAPLFDLGEGDFGSQHRWVNRVFFIPSIGG